jgi:uncharacterized membrane protein YfcA
VLVVLGVGLAAGLLSGFFGVGGGTVIVPALVLLGFTQRRAVATSLAAIVPTAIAAAVAYVVHGHVDWPVAGLIVVGVVTGARVGSSLLSRLSERTLRWAFAGFLVLTAVSQFVFVPQREAEIPLDVGRGVAVVALGVVTGVLSGVLGLGGGLVVVPALTVLFGASDLVARGTSLVMMIPGAATGTWSNFRKGGLVDFKAAALIGGAAIAMTPLGNLAAGALPPRANSVLFGCYIAALFVRSAIVARRKDK